MITKTKKDRIHPVLSQARPSSFVCLDFWGTHSHSGAHVEMRLPGNVIKIYGHTRVHGQKTHGIAILPASIPSLQQSHTQYIW